LKFIEPVNLRVIVALVSTVEAEGYKMGERNEEKMWDPSVYCRVFSLLASFQKVGNLQSWKV
jgi:hypothetical protein